MNIFEKLGLWDHCGMRFFGFLLFFAVLGFASNEYSEYRCGQFQAITGKETRYSYFDTCYVNTKSGWQRWGEYKNRAAASEVQADDWCGEHQPKESENDR